jgi:hypothetical protein
MHAGAAADESWYSLQPYTAVDRSRSRPRRGTALQVHANSHYVVHMDLGGQQREKKCAGSAEWVGKVGQQAAFSLQVSNFDMELLLICLGRFIHSGS